MLLNQTREAGRLQDRSTSRSLHPTVVHHSTDRFSCQRERFRTLAFNLEKDDRTELRHKIVSGAIAPSELSQMSSTDLANEKLQQEIESARLASLRHSILDGQRIAPRAKITHKGEEMIEDMQGYLAPQAPEPAKASEDTEMADGRDRREDDIDYGEDMDQSGSPMAMDSPINHTDLPSASAAGAGFDISEVLGDMGLPAEDVTTTPFKPPSAPPLQPLTIPPASPFGGPPSASARSASFSAGPAMSNHVLASALLSVSQATPTTSFSLDSVWGGAAPPAPPGPNPDLAQQAEAVNDEEIRDTDFDMFFDRGELFEPADETQGGGGETGLDSQSVKPGEPGAGQKSDVESFEALPVIWTGNVRHIPSLTDCTLLMFAY